jgi:hypothetical protein
MKSMLRKAIVLAVTGLVSIGALMADFSYEQTTTVTGGAAAAMMRVAGAFSRQANQPTKTTHLLKGDKMATITANHISIIDLAGETMTEVDLQKKTYSVMTFAQMKQFVEQFAQGANSPEANIKVSANATGATKQVNGLNAKEMVITMEMETTDARSGQKGSMKIVMDSWLAGGIAGYDEVRAFQKRMAEKLNYAPGGGGMMGRPDLAKGMAQAAKEMAKLDGVPVLQVVKMGGAGQSLGGGQMTPEQQAQMAQAQQQAQQQQAQQPPPQQQEQPTAGGVLGSALGGRLGRFGGLGRKKQQPPPQEQAQQQPAAPAQSTPPPATAAPQGDPSVLMETTIEMTNFSSSSVDGSKLEVPAGFKQVESPMMGRKR